jgi:photosystem II stability/assembly factor-like uncharacterized protein
MRARVKPEGSVETDLFLDADMEPEVPSSRRRIKLRKLFVPFLMVLLLVFPAMPTMARAGSGAGIHDCPHVFWQNPLPQGSSLDDIDAADASTAWAVGDAFTVLKTGDGGATWEQQYLGLFSENPELDSRTVLSVSAVDRDSAWAGTDYVPFKPGGISYLFKTVDGGTSWTRIESPLYADLNSISAISTGVAWVACSYDAASSYGYVLRTTDGGVNWKICDPGFAVMEDITSISALDQDNAWICGSSGHIAVTSDGGDTWSTYSPAGYQPLASIQAFDASNAYACGSRYFVTINFSGGTWNVEMQSLGDKDDEAVDLWFPDTQNGWIAGSWDNSNRNLVARTWDGGNNWYFIEYPEESSGQPVFAISGSSPDAVCIAGNYGLLARTGDSGITWSKIDYDFTGGLSFSDLDVVGEKTAWAVGENFIIAATTNGGMSWSIQRWGGLGYLNSVDAVDTYVAWTVGDHGTILKTLDGGATWTSQASGTSQSLFRISAINRDTAWASGENGMLLKTEDGGASWRRIDVGLAGQTLSVAALDASTAWCGSGSDSMLKTTNGGATWEKQTLPWPGSLTKFLKVENVCPVNKDLAFATVNGSTGADDFGYIYKTTNGGGSWTLIDNPVLKGTDRRFCFTDSDDGINVWTCGEDGILCKSTDGGTTWTQLLVNTEFSLYSVRAIDGQAVWLTGPFGTILRSTAPFVYSIAPDSAHNTGSVKISDLAGVGFWEGMSVKLVKGSSEIAASNVVVLSPYKATCEFDLGGAEAGAWDVMVTNVNGLEDRLAEGFHVIGTSPTLTWYLAEGSTGSGPQGGFETWVLITNPYDQSANVKLTYMTPEGEVKGPEFSMPPFSRQTIDVSQTVPDNWSVSTRVESDRLVVAERSVYWSTPDTFRQAAHNSVGLPYDSKIWYLAEGSTGGDASGSFETWILLQNTSDRVATARLTYTTPSGIRTGPSVELPPGTRSTVNVADTLPGEWSVSTTVESDTPIVAERSMYWNAAGTYRQAATDSIGTASPAREWYLPEGSTGSGADGSFETWILVQNPTPDIATANVYYQTPSGERPGPEVKLEPFTRQTLNVADAVPGEFSVSTRVMSDNPIVAEMSCYWNAAGTYRQAAQNSIGAEPPYTEWLLGEGSTGSGPQGGFETWVLIQNPGDETAVAEVNFMTPQGLVNGPTLALDPHTRQTVSVGDWLPGSWEVAVSVEADKPVVAERSIYWDAAGCFRRAAMGSIGYAPYGNPPH